MGGIHDAPASLCLILAFLRTLAVHVDDHRLVVAEKHHVGPFLQDRSALLRELQLPAVIRAQLVRLFKLPHLSMGRDDHIDAAFPDIRQKIEKLPEGFFDVGVALAISEVLDPFDLPGGADMLNTELLRPVSRVDHERLTGCRIVSDILDFLQKHLPGAGRRQSCHVHVISGALSVDKHRVRELARERTFSDAFRAVDHDLLCRRNHPSGNFHQNSPFFHARAGAGAGASCVVP